MGAVDYGTLQDYIFEDDNWTKVDPNTGNVLVIPGQWGEQPLVASSDKDSYWPINNDCPEGNCALFAHDAFTGLFAILAIAGFNVFEDDCLCALASDFAGNDAECQAKLQQIVDNTTGTPLAQVFPPWILVDLNLDSLAFSAVVAFDYWFIGCYGALIEIPNLPVPVPPPQPPPSPSLCCYNRYPSFRS